MDYDAIRRIEQYNDHLRRRNGELLTALEQHAPQAAKNLTPIRDWPTQYQVIDRIVSLAVEYCLLEDPYQSEDHFEQLHEAVMQQQNYWTQVAEERERRATIGKKRWQTRNTA